MSTSVAPVSSPSALRAALVARTRTPADVLTELVAQGRAAPGAPARAEAWRLVAELAGRAFGTPWDVAERAAWALLGTARHADAPAERVALLEAMGRAFRNVWLMPYVHGRLGDPDPRVAEAALDAAGGLGFAGLEGAVARFIGDDTPPRLRLAAVRALGRLGALSAAPAIVTLAGDHDPTLAAAALTALTEMRSPAGRAAAVAALPDGGDDALQRAALRYLAELGADEVMPTLRRLARDEDVERRLAAAAGARSYKAERESDLPERVLSALTEDDRVVRALLARRLRRFPSAEVIAEAELFLGDDAAGVVQIMAELRTPEVTRWLLALAARADQSIMVRARAAWAVEADEAWEQDALGALALDARVPEAVRVAAAQAMGAFASVASLAARLGALADAPAAALRGAWLWALQLAARPGGLADAERPIAEAAVARALADPDAGVRRRAAYVAGNLRLGGLADALVALVRAAGAGAEDSPADAELRAAGFLALEELAPPGAAAAVVALARREEDPGALVCASRALAAIPGADVTPLAGKIAHLLGDTTQVHDDDALEAAARLAGLSRGAVPPAALVALAAAGQRPRVRLEALGALGRLAAAGVPLGADAPGLLARALDDPDPGAQEAAAMALVAVGDRAAGEHVLDWVTGDADAAARARVAAALQLPAADRAHFAPLVDAAAARLSAADPAWEALLGLRLALAAAGAGSGSGSAADAAATAAAVDDAIIAAFPSFRALATLTGFEALTRSLRTAESLYRGAAAGPADADLSPPIVLWMKVLEGFVHAWLGRRLAVLQKDALALYDHVETLTGAAWPTYQRFVAERWPDSVDVGGLRIEAPVRSLANALREYQERRPKRLDQPLSVTEWARLMVFLAVDHPAGVKNLLKVASRGADPTVRLAHRLHVLAGVRNLVTHRQAAGPPVLEAFRRGYYAAFEELAELT